MLRAPKTTTAAKLIAIYAYLQCADLLLRAIFVVGAGISSVPSLDEVLFVFAAGSGVSTMSIPQAYCRVSFRDTAAVRRRKGYMGARKRSSLWGTLQKISSQIQQGERKIALLTACGKLQIFSPSDCRIQRPGLKLANTDATLKFSTRLSA
mmetsp:Transcript_10318/g.14926  ORF Transcript_10318/g.14926 Transcript_10318/m.14926 type:complete len:151 (-) Transcript_10318:738-1190(-)